MEFYSWFPILIFFFLFVVVLQASYLGTRELIISIFLRSVESMTTEAKIDKKKLPLFGAGIRYICYTFVTVDGGIFTKEQRVSPKLFDLLSEGTLIPIVYNIKRPSISRLENKSNTQYLYAVYFSVIVGSTIIFFPLILMHLITFLVNGYCYLADMHATNRVHCDGH